MVHLALSNNNSLTHIVILLWFDRNELTANRYKGIEYFFLIKIKNK